MIGAGLLSWGGWLGGELIYHHQVGVDETFSPAPVSRSLLPTPTGDEGHAS
jgi:hypothetical protein